MLIYIAWLLEVLFEIQIPLLYLYDAIFYGVDDKASGVFAAAFFENIGAVFIYSSLWKKRLQKHR